MFHCSRRLSHLYYSPFVRVREKLVQEDISALAQNKLGLLHVPGFYHPHACDNGLKRMQERSFVGRGVREMLHCESGSRGTKLYYTAQIISSLLIVKNLFSPHASPVDLLRENLKDTWPHGLAFFPLHQNTLRVNLAAQQATLSPLLVERNFSNLLVRIYFSTPREGVRIWGENLLAMGRPERLMPPIVIGPQQGDLLILHAGRLRAEGEASALSSYLLALGEKRPLHLCHQAVFTLREVHSGL